MNKIKLEACNLCNSRQINILAENDPLYKCESCGHYFDNPIPEYQEIEKYYSRSDKYDYWVEKLDGRGQMWERRLNIILKKVSNGNLLDIGTGFGQFLSYAKKYFKVFGTEISDSAIDLANKKYDLNIKKGEIESLSFDQKFDIITLFHVLEHTNTPGETILKCKDLLKKNSYLIIAVPNEVFGIRYLLKRILRFFKIGHFKNLGRIGFPPITLDFAQGEIHLSHFTDKVLKKFLEKNGFNVEKTCLDPYFGATGFMKLFHLGFYYSTLAIKKITRINLYDTILIIAKKNND